ncbi:MAG: bifunctional precorrin-2 dehydrogenase/sirohydrochlorin ferrochelatase [Oscillospiraceae bacterium]|nr:bifunctional precorrin-2 dehydrogenase/sirohydrochlorin ferrochelatase [Oscillospiraceae bacterium]
MAYFPLCIDLTGKRVLLVGTGDKIRDKADKLRPFAPDLVLQSDISYDDLEPKPALVIVGDMEYHEAQRISALCAARSIPVNVVDIPELCTVFFPSLIARGDLTVSVSTGGKSPAAAAYLRRQIESQIPDRTDEILRWLNDRRVQLRESGMMREAVAMAFEKNRPLTEEELRSL